MTARDRVTIDRRPDGRERDWIAVYARVPGGYAVAADEGAEPVGTVRRVAGGGCWSATSADGTDVGLWLSRSVAAWAVIRAASKGTP